MSFIKVEASKNQERKMGIKKEELRNRNERRSEVRMMNAVRRKRSQTMYKRVRVAHCPDVFRIAENNGSQVLGKQLLRSGALIGGPKFWEIRITGETGIMRMLIMIGIIPLSLMASGQTEPQQTTQGQTKESQATTLGKETKAIRVHKFGGPEVLRLEEVPTPRPGPGQVLVRMHAIGVNPIE